MKLFAKSLLLLTLAVASATVAHAGPGGNFMQQIMQQAQSGQQIDQQKLQESIQQMQGNIMAFSQCMNGIGMDKMQELQSKGMEIKQKIDAFCAQGKEEEARRYAYVESMNFMKDPTVIKLRECSQDMVEKLNVPTPDETKEGSICGKPAHSMPR